MHTIFRRQPVSVLFQTVCCTICKSGIAMHRYVGSKLPKFSTRGCYRIFVVGEMLLVIAFSFNNGELAFRVLNLNLV